MGCDAHPCIEVKSRNGRWKLVDYKSWYWEQMDKEGWDFEEVDRRRPSYLNALSNRNYRLFATLFDVRNHHDGIDNPLFGRRGLPEDVSRATVKDIPPGKPGEWSDYHSHTFVTLRELQETNWDAPCAQVRSALFADEFIDYKDNGVIRDTIEEAWEVENRHRWHKNFPEGFHRPVLEEEMLLLLMTDPPKKLIKKRKCPITKVMQRLGPHVVTYLPRSYRYMVPDFVETIPDLAKLGDPDKVRIVIAFDN